MEIKFFLAQESAGSEKYCCRERSCFGFRSDFALNQLPNTRHSLLLRLADASDGEAWNEFLEVYERAIFRFACSRGLQSADAEDVTQRVLEAVLAKSRKWDPASGGSFGAWLFRVTRNLAAKAYRQRDRTQIGLNIEQELQSLDELSSPPDEEKTIFQIEYRKALFHWAAELVQHQFQPETWSAFWMNAVDQKNASDVARELGIAKSAVYVAKCRVLARIRIEIDRFEKEFSQHDEIE